ncbi:MAG: tRNA (adenosine(37)-N6)-threonylcarbamoyltransferase complex dimerization subunit type 1 TsaB [Chitinophagaceae bacterium]|nr:tRNA (adenosine(37)-N6)-threonylcarbamoyltransferase complex dimerization subunit type 1 TsaB [Chitinophagaceae bacterium]
MSLILNIDTALDRAIISLSDQQNILCFSINERQKDHSAWLHPAIQNLLKSAGAQINQLAAVAVNAGPGSYTGLRVGMAAAKGICYALNIPLITVSNLELWAEAALPEAEQCICPVIDARRMEVFTAVYDMNKKELLSPQAMILNENSFTGILKSQKMLFCGNAVGKVKNIIRHPNAFFTDTSPQPQTMVWLSYKKYANHETTNLAYAEPFYLKPFFQKNTEGCK